MDFLCLFGSGSLAGADCPNRFVSQDNLGEVFGREREYGSQLSGYHFVLLVCLALFQHFTDTENRSQTVGKSQFYLFFQNGNSLTVVSATLGVTQDDILGTCRSHHSGGNLTGISTRHLVGAVLGTHTNLGSIYQGSNRCQVDERRTDDYIAVGLFVCQCFIQFFCKSNTLLEGLVHFPVSCNNVLSHFVFIIKRVNRFTILLFTIYNLGAGYLLFVGGAGLECSFSLRLTTSTSAPITSSSGTMNHSST